MTIEAQRPDRSADRIRLSGIEAARGIAAALVVAYHAGRQISPDLSRLPLAGAFQFGHAGVDFFFVLSGFIILFVHRGDIGNPARVRHYAGRRFTRIYPVFWIASLLAMAASTFSVKAWGGYVTERVVKSLLLFPQQEGPLVGGGWTLEHEMLFYVIFAAAIASRRLGSLLIAAWGIGIGIGLAASSPLFGLRFVFSIYNAGFFLGMLTALVLLRTTIRAPRTLLFCGIALFLAIGLAEDFGRLAVYARSTRLAYDFAAATIILGLVESERRGKLPIARHLRQLGAASYSLYLTHLIVLGATYKLLAWAGTTAWLPDFIVFAAMCCAAIAFAILLSAYIERPLLRYSRRLTGGYRETPVSALASTSPQTR